MNLHSPEILKFATTVPIGPRLNLPSATAQCRSPVCGSAIEVDVCLSGEKITDFAFDVKTCALGQAAAA